MFLGKRRLLPRSTDLWCVPPALASGAAGRGASPLRRGSFYNWETQVSKSNSTGNYDVLTDKAPGLLFKNKRDRKVVNVDPRADPGDNTTRTELQCEEYIQVVFYDHITRRKA